MNILKTGTPTHNSKKKKNWYSSKLVIHGSRVGISIESKHTFIPGKKKKNIFKELHWAKWATYDALLNSELQVHFKFKALVPICGQPTLGLHFIG